MHSLNLYGRLAESDSYRGNLTRHAPDWQRSIRAIGGFWTGSFTITADTMGRAEMVNLYNTAIGQRVVESVSSLVTWEGEIVELRLTLDGLTYLRSLDVERWHNKVAVRHPTGITAWAEDTDSSDIYGESCYIDTVGNPYGATAAEARRNRILSENAYPRSRPTGGLASAEGQPAENRLEVTCAGYVFGMNRRYQASDIATANLSAQITTLVGNSEFVTAGRISTNTLQVPVQAVGIYSRLWDTIADFIEAGDANGNRYIGGVWAGRKFHYQAAETAQTHVWRNGRLYDKAGTLVPPPLIRPDIIVRLANSPSSVYAPSGEDLDRCVYIEEVEFTAPDRYRLIPREGAL